MDVGARVESGTETETGIQLINKIINSFLFLVSLDSEFAVLFHPCDRSNRLRQAITYRRVFKIRDNLRTEQPFLP